MYVECIAHNKSAAAAQAGPGMRRRERLPKAWCLSSIRSSDSGDWLSVRAWRMGPEKRAMWTLSTYEICLSPSLCLIPGSPLPMPSSVGSWPGLSGEKAGSEHLFLLLSLQLTSYYYTHTTLLLSPPLRSSKCLSWVEVQVEWRARTKKAKGSRPRLPSSSDYWPWWAVGWQWWWSEEGGVVWDGDGGSRVPAPQPFRTHQAPLWGRAGRKHLEQPQLPPIPHANHPTNREPNHYTYHSLMIWDHVTFDLIWFVYLRFDTYISVLQHWFLKWKRLQAGWKESVQKDLIRRGLLRLINVILIQ
jgi:hypothetical protein